MDRRLPTGGLLDRTSEFDFVFDDRPYRGFRGDTLASALLANGVRVVGRSFKYHRPRGLLCAGPEEPNALVELRSGDRKEPNSKATTVELYAGLVAKSQNRWPSLQWDVLSINNVFSPVFAAGFYYKTFMWPASFWEKVYEPLIRRAAGLGHASGVPDPDIYEKVHAFCDVLIIGGGPAGIAAALEAAASGARVILCDEDFRLGGRLLSENYEIDGQPGASWVLRALDQLAGLSQVKILARTQVFGVYDSGVYGAIERVADHIGYAPRNLPRQRLWKIRAKHAVLSTGALERPLVFAGNDIPGVMLASALRTYIRRYAVVPGRRAVVFTTSDDGWRTVEDLISSGIAVIAVVEARPEVNARARAAADEAKVRTITGAQVIEAQGGRSLQRVIVQEASGIRVVLEADLLAVSGGWSPQISLTTHLGSKTRWSESVSAFVPGDLPPGMSVAGAATGRMLLDQCLSEGATAGAQAARSAGFRTGQRIVVPRATAESQDTQPLWHAQGGRGKAFVDLQNDVTVADVGIAVSEGFRSVEHVKRYTTLGMATDQGKTANVNGSAITAGLTGQSLSAVGTTSARPPHSPLAFGVLAHENRGKSYKPTRFTAAHRWAADQGAVFIDVGNWRRAHYFQCNGAQSLMDAMTNEVRAVRSAVGICDVSTLGKIDVQGADAGAFLDHVYTNLISTIPVGKVRYGLMLREDGFVMDDGTAARLSPNHFWLSTTTTHAALVFRHLKYCLQVIWPDMDVHLTSVTEEWAQFSIAGPRSRELLQDYLGPAVDLSNEAFPYMAATDLRIGGIPARLLRLSFSGELAYELAVPTLFGESLVRGLLDNGRPYGAVPYGLEALGTLRLEKGHVAGGELNGRTTAHDLGLERLFSQRKDFIGKTLAQRPALTASDRQVLVGLKAVQPDVQFRTGALLLDGRGIAGPENCGGYVTSTGYSPTLEGWIGLGVLRRGRERLNTRVQAYDPVRGAPTELEVVNPHFYDPKGERLHG
jgi:methylglutamate dehydrogenase subunit C